MKLTTLLLSTLLGIVTLSSANVAFAIIDIANHPEAQLARTGAPGYGLRLNGYVTDTESQKYTFDFNHQNSTVSAQFDGVNYLIQGQVWGGVSKEYNTDYLGNEGLWTLNWSMVAGDNCPTGYANCFVTGSGTLSSAQYGDYSLMGKANNQSLEFAFIDGFRGVNASSGWGWVEWEHLSSGRTGKGDFLFVEVPEAGTLSLFGIGLIGLAFARRKTDQAT